MDETILFNRVSHGQSPREGSKCCSAGLPLPSALERPPVVHLIVKHGRKKRNWISIGTKWFFRNRITFFLISGLINKVWILTILIIISHLVWRERKRWPRIGCLLNRCRFPNRVNSPGPWGASWRRPDLFVPSWRCVKLRRFIKIHGAKKRWNWINIARSSRGIYLILKIKAQVYMAMNMYTWHRLSVYRDWEWPGRISSEVRNCPCRPDGPDRPAAPELRFWKRLPARTRFFRRQSPRPDLQIVHGKHISRQLYIITPAPSKRKKGVRAIFMTTHNIREIWWMKCTLPDQHFNIFL